MLLAPHKRLRQRGCCVVSVDVASDDEHDLFMPIVIHLAIVNLARQWIRGAFHIGGRTNVGPTRCSRSYFVCFMLITLGHGD